ncbi:hypothetical protein [Klebsiella pneumoniae IS46]|nr:hypothetical protein [Klebsiella pneumoniae IS46]
MDIYCAGQILFFLNFAFNKANLIKTLITPEKDNLPFFLIIPDSNQFTITISYRVKFSFTNSLIRRLKYKS